MCKIIPFPVQESTGFINLKQFFEVSGTVKTTEFYLGTAEELARQNKITQSELLALRRIGRQKLKALESQAAAPVAAPGLSRRAVLFGFSFARSFRPARFHGLPVAVCS